MADEPASEGKVLDLLEQVLELPPSGRAAWLDAAGLAPELRLRLERLLALQTRADRFLGQAPADPLTGLPGPGERLGSWEIVRPLDAGGMGVVFLARRADGSYEQQAAVKLVRPGGPGAPSGLEAALHERFATERRLLARLDHPNIARVLDGGTSPDGLPYLVMEYVEGAGLLAHCDAAGLGLRARVALFRKVCAGVQAAHRHLVVHRDLKPQNILVGADGEPRLLDFGIARLLEGGDAGTGATQLSAMTPAYASPEQLRGEPLTTASDIFSLGVVLYELLTGTRPWILDGAGLAQAERLVSSTAPRPLRQALAGADLPDAERQRRLAVSGPDLERIVAKALHLDPVRRYETAQALADDLGRWLDGRPVLAHPDSTGYRLMRFLGRHRAASVAAGLALAAIVAAAAVAMAQARQARLAVADLGRVNAFLAEVINVSNPYLAGSELTLGQALDEAAARLEQHFQGRPDLALDIRLVLADSMLGRFRLDSAQSQLERALAEASALHGHDDPRTLQALGRLASLRKDQSRFDEASALFEQALGRLGTVAADTAQLAARLLNDYGTMRLIEERFPEAQALLQRAVDIDAAHPGAVPEASRAQTLGNLAHAARGQGDLDRAEALYTQVQAVFERVYPEGGPFPAIVLNNRARLARARGDPETSMALLEQAVAMHRRSFAGDHALVVTPITNLAMQALDLDRLDKAAPAAEEAVAMADRLYASQPHAYQANALVALVGVRLAQDRVAEAAQALGRAEAVLAALAAAPESTVRRVAQLRETVCQRAAGAPGCPPAVAGPVVPAGLP
ncbi:MAG: serine/threonine protein kinase [Xanthomonadales bacterium]|nr:serine/threonine protein kinase [Xanthomonadales bacterium]